MAEKIDKPELCPRQILTDAQALIEAFHPHLLAAEIRYVFVPRMSRHGYAVLGKAAKLAGVAHVLSGANFVIRLNHEAWVDLSDESRAALLDHELCHCGPLDGDQWTMQDHDLGEFRAIMVRHGLWDARARRFVDTLAQQNLFEAEPVGA